jgi:hypothetical protein
VNMGFELGRAGAVSWGLNWGGQGQCKWEETVRECRGGGKCSLHTKDYNTVKFIASL